jgi:hypothetical protein
VTNPTEGSAIATETIPITEIPAAFIKEAVDRLAHYTVGFLRVDDTPSGQDLTLLGSGTLVLVENTHAILTAHHVIQALPRTGRLGLILEPTLHQHTVDTQALVYLEIARGDIDQNGPDIGAVVLAPSVASTIAAKKNFYNLTQRVKEALESPPELGHGVWFTEGFLDERTVEEPPIGPFTKVKAFYCITGAGGPEESFIVDQHDYFEYPITVMGTPDAPQSFGGMSGGGLWQVQIIRDPSGMLRPKAFLLSGVVFFQGPTLENRCNIKCHGRQSVYKVAYNAIRNCCSSGSP